MRFDKLLALGLCISLMAACGGPAEEEAPPAAADQELIGVTDLDEAPGFDFLPPISWRDIFKRGKNHPDAKPTITIVRLHDGAVVATHQPKWHRDAFSWNWKTKGLQLGKYEIRVSHDDVIVGRATIKIGGLGKHGIWPGRTLPIPFRLVTVPAVSAPAPAPDADGDGIPDAEDVCPHTADVDQLDTDGDGIGDACECDDVVCEAEGTCEAPGVCDATTGACVYDLLDDGTPCDDGDACTSDDVCQAGVCGGTLPDTDSDPANCGGCGIVCGEDAPLCVEGACTAPAPAAVQITEPGEAFGHHGFCDGWNDCGDAETCAYWACLVEGYSTLVSYGESKPCPEFTSCNMFFAGPDGGVDWDYEWASLCDAMAVTDIVCSN